MSGSADDVTIVYVTTSSRAEALLLGRAMVEARLAACANVLDGMTAIYRWEGKMHEDDETVLILKTVAGRLGELTRRLRDMHSYDLPCVIAWNVAAGNPPYLDWIRDSTN